MTVSEKDKRRGWQQFWTGIVLYGVLIVGLNVLSGPMNLGKPLVIALTFVPILAALWAMLGWLRAIRAMDEFQQRIVSESAHWSLGITGLVTFSYGLLEGSADLPKLSMLWVWPLINVVFVLANQFIVRRRYR